MGHPGFAGLPVENVVKPQTTFISRKPPRRSSEWQRWADGCGQVECLRPKAENLWLRKELLCRGGMRLFWQSRTLAVLLTVWALTNAFLPASEHQLIRPPRNVDTSVGEWNAILAPLLPHFIGVSCDQDRWLFADGQMALQGRPGD